MTEFHPDTTVWVRDFTYHMATRSWSTTTHPAFDDYPPVVEWTGLRLHL
jgi:hypothetical protein